MGESSAPPLTGQRFGPDTLKAPAEKEGEPVEQHVEEVKRLGGRSSTTLSKQ